MYTAYCTSIRCSANRYTESMSKYSIKEVHKSKIECPDCGSILFWTKKGSYKNAASKKEQSKRKKSDLSRSFDL